MCPTDDFGIEHDEEVAAALKDPKGGLIVKVFDYLGKRKAAELAKEAEEAEKNKPKAPKSIFGPVFGDHI